MSSTTIGNLNVKITGDGDPLLNTLTQLTQAVHKFQARTEKAGSGGGGGGLGGAALIGGLAGGAAAGVLSIVEKITGAALEAGKAMFEMGVHQAEVIDQMAKLSDRTGISTQALAELGYAASLSGVSNEQLTGGLEKMLKTLGEAANGGAEAQAAFAHLGLDFNKLAAQDPQKTFMQLADALKAVENPYQRAADITAIFGKSGQELLPLLQEGSEGLSGMAEEANKFGLAVSRTDAAKVEQANDAFTRLMAMISGLVNTLVVELSPYVTQAINDIIAWATEGDRGAKLVKDGVSLVLDVVKWLGDAWDTVKYAFFGVAQHVTPGLIYIGELELDLLKTLQNIVKWMAKVGAAPDSWAKGMKAAVDQMESDLRRLNKMQQKFEQGFKDASVANTAQNITSWLFRAMKAANDAAKKKGDQMGPPLPPVIDHLGEINDVIKGLRDNVTKASGDDLDQLIKKLEKLGATAEQIDLAKSLFNQTEILKAGKALDDIFSGLQDEISSLAFTELDNLNQKMIQLGATQRQLDDAARLFSEKDALKTSKMVRDAIKTPLDKYDEMLAKINDAVRLGNLSATDAAKYAADQAKSLGFGKEQRAGLLLAGSAQAQLLQYQGGQAPLTYAQRQLSATQTSNSLLTQIKENTKAGALAVQPL